MEKYKPVELRISNNLRSHANLLNNLSKDFSALLNGSQYRQLEEADLKKENVVKNWNNGISCCFESKNSLLSAVKFYSNMTHAIDQLSSDADEFIGRRTSEAKLLIDKIEMTAAERSQLEIQKRLERLNFSNDISAASPDLKLNPYTTNLNNPGSNFQYNNSTNSFYSVNYPPSLAVTPNTGPHSLGYRPNHHGYQETITPPSYPIPNNQANFNFLTRPELMPSISSSQYQYVPHFNRPSIPLNDHDNRSIHHQRPLAPPETGPFHYLGANPMNPSPPNTTAHMPSILISSNKSNMPHPTKYLAQPSGPIQSGNKEITLQRIILSSNISVISTLRLSNMFHS